MLISRADHVCAEVWARQCGGQCTRWKLPTTLVLRSGAGSVGPVLQLEASDHIGAEVWGRQCGGLCTCWKPRNEGAPPCWRWFMPQGQHSFPRPLGMYAIRGMCA